LLLLCSLECFAHQPIITILDSGHRTSLRGLSVVNDNIIWASGSNGTVARSLNGGKNFEWLTVKGYEARDFRDVEAFDANTAIIMAVAEPAVILKTRDGGATWKEVFRDTAKGMFLDAMDFVGDNGVVIGDPVANKIFLGYTKNGGDSWEVSKILDKIPAADGEAFFASSGTNVVYMQGKFAVFVSGGKKSNYYNSSSIIYPLPLLQGKESTGANSIALQQLNGVIVGGDFAKDTMTTGNCVLFNVFPFKTTLPETPPHGYRSCVTYTAKDKLITCGTSGVDISNDGGMNWKLISRQSFHVCQKAKNGHAVFLAGANGKIARLGAF